MGMTIGNESQVLLLLGSLPDNWETFVVTVSNFAPNGVLSMDNVKDNMINEETRSKSSSNSDNSQVFVAENRGRSKSRGPKGQGRSASRSRTRFNGKCHHCGIFGHMKKNCNKLKNEKKEVKDSYTNQKRGDNHTTATAISPEECEVLCIEGECLHVDNSPGVSWVVDSGASFHATPNMDFFTT